MSLILDALSRAEREKRDNANPAPTILSQESVVEQTDGFPWVLVGGVVMLCVAVILMLVLLFRSSSPPQSDPRSVATEASGEGVSNTVLIAPKTQPQIRTSTEQSVDAVAGKVPGAAKPAPTPASAAELPAPTRDSAAGESAAAVAALYASSVDQVVAETAPAAEPENPPAVPAAPMEDAGSSLNESEIDVERVLREIRAEAGNSELVPHPVPLLSDLPKRFKDSVPTLMYSGHDYNSSGVSTVTINGETLTPGQGTRGVEVRELLSDSVILRFDSTEFRLRALNSWVNL